MRTRTEITLERDRLIVVNHRSRKRWCSECALPVQMMRVDDAALCAQVSSRTMFRWAESGVVHSSETAEGLLLICPNSPSLSL
jgi:hypothetical protein